MRVLVTGGAGFVGSHVVERLRAAGDDIAVIDNFTTGRRDTLAAFGSVVQVTDIDIADDQAVETVMAAFRPEVVLHCAASYKDPRDWAGDVRTNVLGTVAVVRAARAHDVRRLVYLQTALCYGGQPESSPVRRDHPLRPENSYAISKTAGERYIALSGLDYLSFRLANVYGPRNLTGPVSAFYTRLAAGTPCVVFDTRRDFVFVDDLVTLLLAALRGVGRPGVYHASSGRDYAIHEVYAAVAAAMGVERAAEQRPRAPHDAASILLDPTDTSAEFGWTPTTPLATGVRCAVEWYCRHGIDRAYSHLGTPPVGR